MNKFLMVFVMLGGCVLATPDEQNLFEAPRFETPRIDTIEAPGPGLLWQPRWHPEGTLLADHDRELWMVTGHGTRNIVSGDDTLGNISLDEHDAIAMSLEEEACLTPNDVDYWGPGNNNWQPIYGPDEDDRGPFVLDWGNLIRYRTTPEALESWGYYYRWTDYYDGGMDDWESFTDAETLVTLRDGTVVRTELGVYYILHERAYLFRPASLAIRVGYREEQMQEMYEARMRDLVRVTTSFTRDLFDACPAMEEL